MIRKLTKLEELYVGGCSFKQWEAEETCKRGSNASLMELKSLSHLAVLWLNYDEYIHQSFVFPSLMGYCIHINCGCSYDMSPSSIRYPTSRTICLTPTDVTTVKACRELFQNVYDFHLLNSTSFQNILPEMDQRGFNDLICLKLLLCDIGCLIDTKQLQVPAVTFSNLEMIDICKTDLREICHGLPPEGFLEKLQTFKMYGCSHMVTIFPAKLWRALKSLKKLVVNHCTDLREVFELDGLGEANTELLSCLTTLELQELPNLRSIWKGPNHHVSLKNLTHLILNNCRSLTYVFSPSLARSLVHIKTLYIGCCDQLEHIISEKDGEEEEVFSDAHPQFGLQNLKILTIYECSKLEYIFPISIVQGLLHVEKIIIVRAIQLRELFGNKEEGVLSAEETNNIVPQPRKSKLKHSPEHSYFRCPAVFPSLQHLEFTECPKLLMHSVTDLLVAPKVVFFIHPHIVYKLNLLQLPLILFFISSLLFSFLFKLPESTHMHLLHLHIYMLANLFYPLNGSNVCIKNSGLIYVSLRYVLLSVICSFC